jgi:recombinational DNA repair ATPase RecF
MKTKYAPSERKQFLRAVDFKLSWTMRLMNDALKLIADNPPDTATLEPWRECIHEAAATITAAREELHEQIGPAAPIREGKIESNKNALRVYLENAIAGTMHLKANGHEISASQVLRLVMHELNSRGFVLMKDGVEYHNLAP